MKTLCLFLLIAVGTAAQEKPVSRDHTDWVAASLRTIHTVKPGITRADVLKVFKTKGGISNQLQRKYVFRDCPDVEVDAGLSRPGEGPASGRPGRSSSRSTAGTLTGASWTKRHRHDAASE
jgi:hypothetical protein